jgi:hypothetical protein
MPDFVLQNHFSLVLLIPQTDEARAWVEENIPDEVPRWCGAVAIEPRYVENVVWGINGDGLTVAE